MTIDPTKEFRPLRLALLTVSDTRTLAEDVSGDILEARMRETGLDPEEYWWYLDLRRYGSVPHAGFGLGLERTVGWICGTKHVRECAPWPRMMQRLTP